MKFFMFIVIALVHFGFLGKVYAVNQPGVPLVLSNESDSQSRNLQNTHDRQRENTEDRLDNLDMEHATEDVLRSVLSDARQTFRELGEKLKQKDQMISSLEKNVKDLSHHLQQLDWLAGRISGEKFEVERELLECTQTHPSLRRQQPNPFYTNPFGLNPHQPNPFQLNPLRLTPFKTNPFQ